jgi:sialate O-acetylesterase
MVARLRFAALGCLALLDCARAQSSPSFQLAAIFGDHMVVPAGATLPLHGRAEPGLGLAVETSWGAKASATAGADGRFELVVATPRRGQTGSLTVRAGADQRTLQDLLAGDVWLASGQSNMEMALGKHDWSQGIDGHEALLAAADLPQLRLFTVQQQASEAPAADVQGHWEVCSPATAARCSATAFCFARDLLAAGHGPIGLVVSAWGGTVAEAWVRESGLAPFPEFGAALRQQREGQGGAKHAAASAAFWAAVDAASLAAAARPGAPIELPDPWSRSGLEAFDGVVRYRCDVELPAAFRGVALWLELGAIDDMDTVFVGGVRLAGHERDGAWSTARRYALPATQTLGPRLALEVRVVDTGGEGGFTSPAAQLCLRAVDGGAVVPLAGAGWRREPIVALAELPPWPRSERGPNRPAVLWNGMIAPLLPFPFRGAIWYQGESNRARHEQYSRLFPQLITDWRAAIGGPLPFYFVQIAPFGYRDEAGDRTPRLREAQAAALRLPATGMVVTLDVGDAGDIHPTAKLPVGQRLAALARAGVYGEAVPCTGPQLASARRVGDAVELRFTGAAEGLELVGDGGGFELAAADGTFRAAKATLRDDVVSVRADGIAAPAAVRYAWAAVPAWSLRDRRGFPAAPFSVPIRASER